MYIYIYIYILYIHIIYIIYIIYIYIYIYSRGAAHSICNLRFNVPNEIPVVFSQWVNL